MQAAGLGIEHILPNPEDGAQLRRPNRQTHTESSRCGEIGGSGRIDFMQGRPRDPPAKRSVQSGHPKTHPAGLGWRNMERRLREVAAQIGQGGIGRWAHE